MWCLQNRRVGSSKLPCPQEISENKQKLSEPTFVKTLEHGQRFTTTKQMLNKEKGNSQKLLAYPYIFYNKSVITLNIKGLNIPVKGQRLSNWNFSNLCTRTDLQKDSALFSVNSIFYDNISSAFLSLRKNPLRILLKHGFLGNILQSWRLEGWSFAFLWAPSSQAMLMLLLFKLHFVQLLSTWW